MLLTVINKIINRDLDKLIVEIESYQNEEKMWIFDQSISNSGGNLCLHLIGNLNTYIGQVLGETGYIRNRELEFSDKNVPKQVLLNKILETKKMVSQTLENMKEKDLLKEYPIEVSYGRTTIEHYLVHCTVHLAYHLGQINYHRRIFDIS